MVEAIKTGLLDILRKPIYMTITGVPFSVAPITGRLKWGPRPMFREGSFRPIRQTAYGFKTKLFHESGRPIYIGHHGTSQAHVSNHENSNSNGNFRNNGRVGDPHPAFMIRGDQRVRIGANNWIRVQDPENSNNRGPNLTKASGKIRLSSNVKNAITQNNLGKIIIQVWNSNTGNRQYMKPNTFKQFLKNGVYISPYSRNPGYFKILSAMFNKVTTKNNTNNLVRQGMTRGRNLNNQRRKRQNRLIAENRVGMPNTSSNEAFARSLARRN
jgi:hypothetical protein